MTCVAVGGGVCLSVCVCVCVCVYMLYNVCVCVCVYMLYNNMDVLLHFRFSEIYMNINFHILIFSAVHISTPANSEFVFFANKVLLSLINMKSMCLCKRVK